MKRELEIAWAAGLFEGEGCFSIWNRKSGWVNPGLQLTSTDRDVIDRFCRVLGIGRVYTIKKPSAAGKTMYHWTAAGPENLRQVYELFSPYLGERRRARAEEIMLLRAKWEASRATDATCEECGMIYRRANHRSTVQRFCSRRCRDKAAYRLRKSEAH